jgi:hypothetical protein
VKKTRDEAELHEAIGRAYVYLGSPIKAERHYARAWDLNSRLCGPLAKTTWHWRNRLAWTVAR